jgi:hypothetical protein
MIDRLTYVLNIPVPQFICTLYLTKTTTYHFAREVIINLSINNNP